MIGTFASLIMSAHLALFPAAIWCDSCGEPLEGSHEAIVCDCHGIHGSVCRDCAEWHEMELLEAAEHMHE